MPYRRRRIKQTRTKGFLQHSGTDVQTLGPAVAPTHFTIFETDVGARTTDGSQQIVTAERNTGDNCNVGDLVKYINVFLECGPRKTTSDTTENAFLEWVVKFGRESEPVIPITNLGTQTLMVVANRMFPKQIALSGFIPIGKEQPNGASIQIKVPKKFQYLKTGDTCEIITYVRSTNVAETGTTSHKCIASYLYKAYS